MNYNFIFFFNDTQPTEIYTLSLKEELKNKEKKRKRKKKNKKNKKKKKEKIKEKKKIKEKGKKKKRKKKKNSHMATPYADFCSKKKTKFMHAALNWRSASTKSK